MREAPLKNWLWSYGPGVSLVPADSMWNYTARAAVDGIFGSPPAGFYALLCSTDVKKFVEFYAYFLFCTDFNFVAHLGMM